MSGRTSTQRINSLINLFEHYDTELLCYIYNEKSTECLFNNYNASTKAYVEYKASEYCLAGRKDKCYIAFEDKMVYIPEEN